MTIQEMALQIIEELTQDGFDEIYISEVGLEIYDLAISSMEEVPEGEPVH